MYLYNASSPAIRTPRVPSNNENPNILSKTPRTKDIRTQQRRRCALGDISNRENGLSISNTASSFSTLKQRQIKAKLKADNAAPSSKKSENILKSTVAFNSLPPAIHVYSMEENRLGRTTRWFTDQEEDFETSPFEHITQDELFEVDSVLCEIDKREQKKQIKEQTMVVVARDKRVNDAFGCWDAGFEHLHSDGVVYNEESLKLVQHMNSLDVDDGPDLLSSLDDLNF